MNTSVFKAASEHAGPIVLGAGIAVMAVAVFTGSHGGRAQAAPVPTVTVTPPPRVLTVAPSPSPSPRVTATLVGDRRAGANPRPGQQAAPGASGASSGRVGAAQAPPSPSRTAAPDSSCTGHVLAVQLRVLGDCALTVGGSR